MKVKHLAIKRKFSPRNRYFFSGKQIRQCRWMEFVIHSRVKRGEDKIVGDKTVIMHHACGCGCGPSPFILNKNK